MAQSYDIQNFLLDRANIHDVITRAWFLVDYHDYNTVAEECPMPTVLSDYTALFGGEPTEVAAQDLVTRWKGLLDHMDSTQHLATSLLIELPQPGAEVEEPETAKVTANAQATLVRSSAKGDPKVQSAGRYVFTVAKAKSEAGKNPWRIAGIKIELSWRSGNWDVYSVH